MSTREIQTQPACPNCEANKLETRHLLTV